MSTWRDVERGDLIRVELGEDILQGRVDYIGNSRKELALLTAGSMLKHLEQAGYALSILEKAALTEPTESGMYIGATQKSIYVARMDNGDIKWENLTTGRAEPYIPYKDLPLDKFHPRRDTVKEVRTWFLTSAFSWGSVDKDAEMIRALDKHFGLEDT